MMTWTAIDMDAKTANQAYDILVQHCRADEKAREYFLHHHIGDTGDTGHSEYRFMGSLGFGGKFRISSTGRVYVDCYPEDETEERKWAIAEANVALDKLLGVRF